jgi:hypothetical protein
VSRRSIIGWARPLDQGEAAARQWHGVVAIATSVETSCVGRWGARERREFVDGRDRDVDSLGCPLAKCPACELHARMERTEEGLAELAAADLFNGGTR